MSLPPVVGAFDYAFSQAFDPPDIPEPAAAAPTGPVYADVELLLVEYLVERTGLRVCTDLPAGLAQVLPVVQVTRVGGTDQTVTLDRPLVDVDAYAANRSGAAAIASQVRDLLRFDLAGSTYAGVLVARVDTLSGPSWRPYDNTGLRRFGASYQLTTQKGSQP